MSENTPEPEYFYVVRDATSRPTHFAVLPSLEQTQILINWLAEAEILDRSIGGGFDVVRFFPTAGEAIDFIREAKADEAKADEQEDK